MSEDDLEKLLRNTVQVISVEDLRERLEESERLKRPLRVKLGVDPTAPDLHLGHYVGLRKLREFQKFGHIIVFVIGDFTARIGDPSGRIETRKSLSEEDVKANAETYAKQVFKVLDREKMELRFNSEWLGKLSSYDIIRLTSNYTVARMLERDDFQKRFSEGRPISIHEFLYPLFQAYDSVAIRADIETGGTDQTFNLLVGREIQPVYGQKPQIVLTWPIIEGLDGVVKMSKSYGNYVALEDPPMEMYGKLMSIPDHLIIKYLTLLTDFSDQDIRRWGKEMENGYNPKLVKEILAIEIVSTFYSRDIALECKEEFNRIFSQRELPKEIPDFYLDSSYFNREVLLVDLLFVAGLVSSKSEARRLIRQRGVKLDGSIVEDPEIKVRLAPDTIIQVGKRKFLRLKSRA
ncbi:MAG TPA: tyrosine--tRNA ligase [bacterium]|nr:tyrosine--tRNA ligase [Dictyoglomota bacterium]HHV81896.1 tyrosine--tRNA ligase [bacterium]HOP56002.1 tyrosine--tRNA ligase [bacterium]